MGERVGVGARRLQLTEEGKGGEGVTRTMQPGLNEMERRREIKRRKKGGVGKGSLYRGLFRGPHRTGAPPQSVNL